MFQLLGFIIDLIALGFNSQHCRANGNSKPCHTTSYTSHESSPCKKATPEINRILEIGVSALYRRGSLNEVLDLRVGDWPLHVAMEIVRTRTRCNGEDDVHTGMMNVLKGTSQLYITSL